MLVCPKLFKNRPVVTVLNTFKVPLGKISIRSLWVLRGSPVQGSVQELGQRYTARTDITRGSGKVPRLRQKEGPPGMNTLDPHNGGGPLGTEGMGIGVDS